MTEAGQWGAVLTMLAGESLPVPPANGAAIRHYADFGPDTEKQIVRVFGNEDRANFRPLDALPNRNSAPTFRNIRYVHS